MIHFDVTKAAEGRHASGLQRVSRQLLAALGPAATPVRWDAGTCRFRTAAGAEPGAGDWLLTPEVFAPEERPGFAAWLARRPCPCAAIFHDAIPLRLPHVTWPRSVARHPAYLRALAELDAVWAVSAASRDELVGYWRWAGVARPPPVKVLPLGADFDGSPRAAAGEPAVPPRLLCVGILEPRKQQTLLVAAAERLWAEGRRFELHLAGRENPHFGAPVRARIAAAARRHPGALHFHVAPDDATLRPLLDGAVATLFPSLAEGCGLPVLESLWRGVPCLASDLPAHREHAAGGGCRLIPPGDVDAWTAGLRAFLDDPAGAAELRHAAGSRELPTWAEAAARLRGELGEAAGGGGALRR
jgi:glycosyltransferase involved in cell wall biosynthesis